jgi:glycosyltransferase involved in cell wall biosynthesis
VREHSVSSPLRPPLGFALDPFIPLRIPEVNTWFGFNSLACARGLVARGLGRAGSVVYWCVDFVPDRFGQGAMTRAYDTLDRICVRSATFRFELAAEARDARNARHTLDPSEVAPTRIVPMGAWVERVPRTPEDGFRARRIVFLGHLVARQGVEVLLEALALLRSRGIDVSADIVGGGPLLEPLKTRTARSSLGQMVRLRGFLPDHRDVEHVLSEGSLGVAPYDPAASSFTRYADPGKLKAYLAAGLPILLTEVPPNARALAAEAGAEIVDFDPADLAHAIERSLSSESEWRQRRAAALAYARRFDWNVVLGEALAAVGVQP